MHKIIWLVSLLLVCVNSAQARAFPQIDSFTPSAEANCSVGNYIFTDPSHAGQTIMKIDGKLVRVKALKSLDAMYDMSQSLSAVHSSVPVDAHFTYRDIRINVSGTVVANKGGDAESQPYLFTVTMTVVSGGASKVYPNLDFNCGC